MKLCRKIHGKVVVVMIDTGATNNFISPTKVAKLKILITPTEEFVVILGTDETRKRSGVCR